MGEIVLTGDGGEYCVCHDCCQNTMCVKEIRAEERERICELIDHELENKTEASSIIHLIERWGKT